MRRTSILLLGVVILLGLLVAGRVGSMAVAQDATPPPGGFEIAPGVTAEGLAFAMGQEAPSLYRLTFAPGVIYRVEPAPDISLAYLETGALTLTLDAPVTITRAGSSDAPGEAVTASTEFTVEAGDYFVLPPLASGEVRNDGEVAASVMVAAIVPAGMGTLAAGTPAP